MIIELTIESLDQEGRGVAHADGKVVFVEGALPGERVDAESSSRSRRTRSRAPSTHRKRMPRGSMPRCPHFGVCGGCTLQHADDALQIAAKQRALEEALRRIGRVRPETLLPPIARAGVGLPPPRAAVGA